MADGMHGLRRSGASVTVARLVAALFAVVVLSVMAVGCGSSSRAAGPSTVPDDPSCPLTRAQVEDLIGSGAEAVAPPPLGTALTTPEQRCQYRVGSSSVQASTFPGTDVATQLRTILTKAQPSPEVGPGAYCDAHQGTTDASLSCVFLARGKTMVLAVDVPNAVLTDDLQANVRTVASVLANQV